jgi:hypothetical protein
MRRHLSIVGLLLGAMFFAFSLTPSLLPGSFLIHGALSGLAFAAGYGLGVAAVFLLNYLQLPLAGGRAALAAKVLAPRLTGSVVAGPSSFFSWSMSVWIFFSIGRRALSGCPAIETRRTRVGRGCRVYTRGGRSRSERNGLSANNTLHRRGVRSITSRAGCSLTRCSTSVR